jgi:hypothetical protein
VNGESTALVITPHTFAEAQSLATSLAASDLLPLALRKKVPDVLMTIMAGQELGIPPIAALRTINVIDGKTVLSADIMVAVVRGRGACEYFKRISASDTEATYETKRRGDAQPQRVTWTIEQAKKAGLHLKDNWRLYPRAMLSSRAKSELARDVYPDVLAGCYTDDEISESTSAPPRVSNANADVVDAEIVEPSPADVSPVGDAPTPDPSPITIETNEIMLALADAPDEEAVKALAARCNLVPKGTPERLAVMAAYRARIDKVRGVAA